MWVSVRTVFVPKLVISVGVGRDWVYDEWEADEVLRKTNMGTQGQVNKHPKRFVSRFGLDRFRITRQELRQL